MRTVICHTEGCSNAQQAISLETDPLDPDGLPVAVDAVICGVCGQPITDILPPLDQKLV